MQTQFTFFNQVSWPLTQIVASPIAAGMVAQVGMFSITSIQVLNFRWQTASGRADLDLDMVFEHW
jgi:hypothetical protein